MVQRNCLTQVRERAEPLLVGERIHMCVQALG